MSAQQKPDKIVYKEREPRTPRFDIEPFILPAVLAGGLIVVVVYKDEIVSIIDKIVQGLPSIDEIIDKIPKPSPEPEPTDGNGAHQDTCPSIPCATGYECVNNKCVKKSTTPTAGVDKNGIKKIYPTAGGKETYNAQNSDNPGRKEWEINTKGYLNMECTGYIKAGGDQIAIKMRGGHHNDSCPKCGCCVEVRFHVSGSGDNFATECPHPDYQFKSISTKFSKPNIKDKWVGVKGIVFNSGSQIKVQAWMDTGGLDSAGKPANNWKLWFETTVSDSKFAKNPVNGPDALVYFRIDNTNTTAKYLSVREIKPTSSAFAYAYQAKGLDRITVPY